MKVKGAKVIRPPKATGELALSGRKSRKKLYKQVQRALKSSNRKVMVDRILSGTYAQQETSIPPGAEQFWTDLFQTDSVTDDRRPEAPVKIYTELLDPIREDEITSVLKRKSAGSPGLDGYTWKDVKKIDIKVITNSFNLWLLSGMIPTGLERGITTLIPKVIGTEIRHSTGSRVPMLKIACYWTKG